MIDRLESVGAETLAYGHMDGTLGWSAQRCSMAYSKSWKIDMPSCPEVRTCTEEQKLSTNAVDDTIAFMHNRLKSQGFEENKWWVVAGAIS